MLHKNKLAKQAGIVAEGRMESNFKEMLRFKQSLPNLYVIALIQYSALKKDFFLCGTSCKPNEM